MTDTELINWIECHINLDFELEFLSREERVIFWLDKKGFVGSSVRDCLEQAANYLPMETTL